MSVPDFLVHNEGDHVAVAVRDVAAGPAIAVYMDSEREQSVELFEDIPLGHKVALINLGPDTDVIEYGVRIGITKEPIRPGQLVHVHNLRSARWQPR